MPGRARFDRRGGRYRTRGRGGGGRWPVVSAAAGSFDSCRDWLPVYSGDGKRLAIVNRSEIVIPRANGDILRRLPVSAGAVAWSPDGRRIAYTKSYTDPCPRTVLRVCH